MEAIDWLVVTACIAGACCAASFAGMAVFAIHNRNRMRKAAERSGVEGSLAAVALRRGIPAFRAPARALLSLRRAAVPIGALCDALCAAGRTTSPDALASVLLVAALLVGIASSAVAGSLACGAATVVCFALLVGAWGARAADRRRTQLREGIPEALQSMKSCFQVGYSLPQTLHEVREGSSGPLASLFGEAEGVLEMGGGVEDALAVIKERGGEPELVFLSAALEIQHRTGSSMQHVLEVTRQSVVDEVELKRTLRVQTAQAKLSAQIVTIMPFALIAVFSLVSPGFLSPFFESAVGVALLVVALTMQMAGVALVRRCLKVEVG